MDAIIYTSNTGFTEQYAQLAGTKMSVPVYSLKEASKKLKAGAAVIYMGWLMAGNVNGYKKAAKKYNVLAVCGVGMGETGSQLEDIRTNNQIPESIPVFSLQGGFDMSRLRGIYKFMMKMMSKGMSEKQDRTPEEDDMLDMLVNGGNRVSESNLTQLLEWYESTRA